MSRSPRGHYEPGYCRELVWIPDGSERCTGCGGDGLVSVDGTHGESVEQCSDCAGNGYVAKQDDQLEAELEASADVVAARKAMASRGAA